ncbi:MAG: hemolysin family protein [candidate division WOR-3 bacterium]
MHWYLIAVAVLVGLSALFSGSEAAMLVSYPGSRGSLRTASFSSSQRLSGLLQDPPRLLATILVANLLVNTSASSLFTLFTLDCSRRTGYNQTIVLTAAGILMTTVLLLFGEVTPKLLASRFPRRFAALALPVIEPVHLLLRPFTSLLVHFSSRLALLRRDPELLSDDEMHTMIEIGYQRGILAPGEEEILSRLIGLEKRTVSEVMTPRIDIVGVPDSALVRDAAATARSSGFSRLPMYHGSLDHITGIVYAKELLTADPDAPASSIARQPFFVPEVKRLLELLDELRRKGSHIAVVVDEFGQTAGIVTLEDLLEAVFGEITDEQDVAEELPWCPYDAHSYLVDGEIDIATLNRLFRNAFAGIPHERLSAFIAERLGRLPQTGDSLRFGSLLILVHQTDGRKLERVLIRPVAQKD